MSEQRTYRLVKEFLEKVYNEGWEDGTLLDQEEAIEIAASGASLIDELADDMSELLRARSNSCCPTACRYGKVLPRFMEQNRG